MCMTYAHYLLSTWTVGLKPYCRGAGRAPVTRSTTYTPEDVHNACRAVVIRRVTSTPEVVTPSWHSQLNHMYARSRTIERYVHLKPHNHGSCHAPVTRRTTCTPKVVTSWCLSHHHNLSIDACARSRRTRLNPCNKNKCTIRESNACALLPLNDEKRSINHWI